MQWDDGSTYCGRDGRKCVGENITVLRIYAALHSLETCGDGLKAIFINEKEMYSVILNEKSAFLDLMYGGKVGTVYSIDGIEENICYTNDIKMITLKVFGLMETYRYGSDARMDSGTGRLTNHFSSLQL